MEQEIEISKNGNPRDWISSRATFDDFDVTAAAAKLWKAELIQLDAGRVRAELVQILSPSAMMLRCFFAGGVEQRGELPQGFRTFGIPLADGSSFLWRGHHLEQDHLLLYPKGAGLESRSFSGFHIYAFSVRESVVDQIAEREGLDWPCSGEERVVKCHHSTIQELRNFARRLEEHAIQKSSVQPCVPTMEALHEELAARVMIVMNQGMRQRARPMARDRSRALREAVDLIESVQRDVISVTDLCEVAGVSRRTLQYAFEERYRVSPNQYLKTRRLIMVKRHLQDASPSEARVGEIAGRYGFWHMGQLAADFRNLFGLLPSEVLGSRR